METINQKVARLKTERYHEGIEYYKKTLKRGASVILDRKVNKDFLDGFKFAQQMDKGEIK